MVFRFTILTVLIATGCTTAKNFAPVRPYSRDLVKVEKNYIVKQGDTLYSIGFRSGHGYQQLAKWNKILPPYQLRIGQKIKLEKVIDNKKKGSTQHKKKNLTNGKVTSEKKTSTVSRNSHKLLKLSWQWPIKGKILKKYAQSGNKGIDIVGKVGWKVKSAASGKVVYSGSGLKGYGKLLIIKHNYLYLSAYANNNRLLVNEGDRVKKGQIIAEVGRVAGHKASLHFEIRKNGNPVNPLNYLPKK